MDVAPTPVSERLARAGRLVQMAAQAGAQVIVLPEVFNTGYVYSDANFYLAEPSDGATVAWMRETAVRLDVHLAGSLLLRERGEIYNALLLTAPDGRTWRYDKRYPWGWERGYFRPGRGASVAHTDLGDVGMLICWDTAHRNLWRAYAGRVDMVIASNSPPDVSNPIWRLPDGSRVTMDDTLLGKTRFKGETHCVFGPMLAEQAAWLGVPVVSAGMSGRFQSAIPNGRAFLLSTLPLAPRLVTHLRHADGIMVESAMTPCCKIVDAQGRTRAEATQEQGETFIVAEVTLAGAKAAPRGPQPPSRIMALSYVLSDVLLPLLAISNYWRNVKNG